MFVTAICTNTTRLWRPQRHTTDIDCRADFPVSFAKEPYKRDLYSAKEPYIFKEPTEAYDWFWLPIRFKISLMRCLRLVGSLKKTGLYCKRALQKRPIFCKRDLCFKLILIAIRHTTDVDCYAEVPYWLRYSWRQYACGLVAWDLHTNNTVVPVELGINNGAIPYKLLPYQSVNPTIRISLFRTKNLQKHNFTETQFQSKVSNIHC